MRWLLAAAGLLSGAACHGEVVGDLDPVVSPGSPATTATADSPAAPAPLPTPATPAPSAPVSPAPAPSADPVPPVPSTPAVPTEPAPTPPAPPAPAPAPAPAPSVPAPMTPAPASWWKPAVGTSFAWQLTGSLDMTQPVQAYDVDLFDTSAAQVAALRARGIKTICYISVGSVEDWRPDKSAFPAAVIGKNYDGWPGERWLDIRQIDKLAPVMRARLDLCKQKGFDAIEPDNMDAYQADTGFPLTREHQLAYNRWLAAEAHQRGLSIGLKNAPALAVALEPSFDWALTENCYEQDDWCGDLSVFVKAGKPVFMTEYQENMKEWDQACSRADTLQFTAILKRLDLDAWTQRCP